MEKTVQSSETQILNNITQFMYICKLLCKFPTRPQSNTAALCRKLLDSILDVFPKNAKICQTHGLKMACRMLGDVSKPEQVVARRTVAPSNAPATNLKRS